MTHPMIAAIRPRAPRPLLALVLLWMLTALLLGAWGFLSRPHAGAALLTGAREWRVLPDRPAAPIVTLWVHWAAPRGAVGWVVLEPGHPWPGSAEASWRRRVLPGWNQLVWDNLSGFPADRPVRLRILAGAGRWTLAAPTTSSGYSLSHLGPLSGLLVALALGVLAAAGLAWRAARAPSVAGRRPWLLLVLGTAGAALALRLYTLTTQSFWFDEVLTAIGAQSFAWVLYSPQVFGHPPLQYLIAWAIGGAHAAEGWMRGPFVAAGVAAVVAVGLLGRRLLGGPTGLVAATLLAVSPFHIELSQLARPYALLVLGVALSWLCLFAALEHGRALDWMAFSVAAALSWYAHYLAGIVLLAQALVALAWVAQRRGESGLRAIVSFAAIAVLLAPWATTLTRLVQGEMGTGRSSTLVLRQLVRGALVPELLGSGAAAGFTGALLVLGLWRVRRRPEIAIAVIALLALPLLLVWATNPTRALAGRYFAFVLPMLVIAIAHGLVSAARIAGRWLAPRLRAPDGWPRRAVTVAATLVLILLNNLAVRADLGEYYRWRQGSDWRTVAAVLDRVVAPDDAVVATLGAVYPLRYYWGAAVIEVDAQALREHYRPVPAGRRLWIITLDGWDWAPDLHRWLDANAVHVGEVPPSWSLTRVHIHRARGELY